MIDHIFEHLIVVNDWIPWVHPVVVLLVFLLGAQVPNIVRLVSSVSRIIRRILPY